MARIKQADPRDIESADKTLVMTFLHWDADAPVRPLTQSPLPTAVCATGTGTATFRTSWRSDAIYAAILGGGRSRACFGHAHADCGHVNLSIGGEYLAIDTGRYNWPEDQHSVVLVDGATRASLPPGTGMGDDHRHGTLLRQFQRHRMLDACVADATPIKGTVWALRQFLFVRTGGDDAYVVLFDNMNKDDGRTPCQYWWQLQCADQARVVLTGDTTATVHGCNARIDCAFFQKPEAPVLGRPHTLMVAQDTKEWIWPYGRDDDTTAFERLNAAAFGEGVCSIRRPRLLAIQDSVSCVMLSVLSPRRKGQPARVLRQIPVTNGIGVEVSGDGVTDTILAAPDHKLILTDTVKCFSEFAVIRRDENGQLVDTWTQSGEPIHFR